MTKSQTTKAADQNMAPAATQAIASTMDASRLVNENTRGVLVLFPYLPKDGAAGKGKEYPVMAGHIDTRTAKIPVAAFSKMTEEGREYLSMSIGFNGHEHISGAMFRQEQKDPDNGKWEIAPGKGNDRFGTISRQIKEGEAYITVLELRFYGVRKLSRQNVPYIKAQIYPQRKEGEQPANDHVMEGCF